MIVVVKMKKIDYLLYQGDDKRKLCGYLNNKQKVFKMFESVGFISLFFNCVFEEKKKKERVFIKLKG